MISQMNRSLRVLLALAAISSLAACLHIFREIPEHFNFNHQLHADEMEIECLTCHGEIIHSTDARTRNLPTMKVCEGCHEREIGDKDCGRCHIDPRTLEKATQKEYIPKLVQYEHPLNFSHKDHLPRVEEDCLACHPRVLTSTHSADEKLPTMAPCMKCHQENYDRLHCSKCHSDLTDPRYGPELTRFVHEGDWMRDHQLGSEQQDPTACVQCHIENFCADCHNGVDNKAKISTVWPRRSDRHYIHRGDYVSRHPIDANRDTQQCLGCHRVNTCSDCHERSGVRYLGSATGAFGGNHPLVSVSGGQHDISARGIAAIRRNIVQCAACHESSSPTCLNCHSERTLGINPHPPGFKSTFNPSVRPVCKKCHTR